MRTFFLLPAAFLALISTAQAYDFKDTLQKTIIDNLNSTVSSTTNPTSSLNENQIIKGLQEALKVGTERVVNQIGTTDGYNQDPAIHIPLPAELQQVQKLLGKVGMSSLADDVELKINRAAEQAAPKAKDIVFEAISNMKLEDAQAIYQGPEDAATQYFKKVSSDKLRAMIEPVAKDSLNDVGALQAYDTLIGEYKSMPFVPDVKADLVNHTTTLAMDGIFHYLAQEEAAIRNDPAKRTTEILKTVFGQ